MIERIDKVKMKLVGVIEKKLDSDTITSRELFDYAQILSNLKSADEYKDMMKHAFATFGNPNMVNGNCGGFLN